MRIAYLACLDVGRESGALKKVVAQITAWASMEHEVVLFALSRSETPWEGARGIPIRAVRCGAAGAFFAAHSLARRVVRWRPDCAYFRWGPCYPSLIRLTSRFPSVVEINSDDIAEGRVVQTRLRYAYQRVTRGFMLRGARGLVCVTGELARRFRRYQKPMAVVSNGIDLSVHASFRAPASSPPRLLFIGSSRHVWNGLDKLVHLARRFADWQFDVIGCNPGELGGAVPPNVTAHGPLGRGEYVRIARSADIAVGPLALHRKEMDEACPLKVREYLADGIPTIIGYDDTDFPGGAPFLLRLPNAPDNVASSAPAIEKFVASWRGERVPRQRISHLDVRIKEQQRLAFFRTVL